MINPLIYRNDENCLDHALHKTGKKQSNQAFSGKTLSISNSTEV